MNIFSTVVFFFLTLVLWEEASAVSGQANLWKQARTKQLSTHPYWLKLLHYKKSFFSFGNGFGTSEIISPRFFLSPKGKFDSAAELQVTIKALFQAPQAVADLNQHAQCRFIARFHWLKKQLDFSQVSLPQVTCPLFQKWSQISKIKSISFIFASGFMENPASFYGHILMKLNITEGFHSPLLLNPAINFGALVPPTENSIRYLFRGLFGGYPGGFTIEEFYIQNHIYGEVELRDLCEYELNLTQDQKEKIVYHAWELLNSIKFRYYFLRENCAYRMGELLELVLEDEVITTDDIAWTIPVNVFHRLKQVQNQGKPLIKNIRLIPSRQRRLQYKAATLSTQQKEWVETILEFPEELNSSLFHQLPEIDQVRILDTLIDYYQYQITQNEEEVSFFKLQKRKVLRIRSKLPVVPSLDPPDEMKPKPPTQGTPPAYFRFGVVSNSKFGGSLEVATRGSYYDLLGKEEGHLEDSQLTPLDIRFHIHEEQVALDRFDILNVQQYATSQTGLSGDSSLSWRLEAGWRRADLSCFHCPVAQINFGLGKSAKLTLHDLWYAMLVFYYRTPTPNFEGASAGFIPVLGMTFAPNHSWKLIVEAGYQQSYSGKEISESRLRWENRITLHPLWEFRLEYERYVEEEVILALNYYW